MPLAIETPLWALLLERAPNDDSFDEVCHWRPERETKKWRRVR